jgi:hypothetical protein
MINLLRKGKIKMGEYKKTELKKNKQHKLIINLS